MLALYIRAVYSPFSDAWYPTGILSLTSFLVRCGYQRSAMAQHICHGLWQSLRLHSMGTR